MTTSDFDWGRFATLATAVSFCLFLMMAVWFSFWIEMEGGAQASAWFIILKVMFNINIAAVAIAISAHLKSRFAS